MLLLVINVKNKIFGELFGEDIQKTLNWRAGGFLSFFQAIWHHSIILSAQLNLWPDILYNLDTIVRIVYEQDFQFFVVSTSWDDIVYNIMIEVICEKTVPKRITIDLLLAYVKWANSTCKLMILWWSKELVRNVGSIFLCNINHSVNKISLITSHSFAMILTLEVVHWQRTPSSQWSFILVLWRILSSFGLSSRLHQSNYHTCTIYLSL